MTDRMRLTDAAIRAVLTPDPSIAASAGLADAIRAAIDVTPQRRAGLLGWGSSPRTRLVLQLVAFGLLLMALALGALVVGSRLGPSPSVTTYHGGPERTGVMPGPGPHDTPTVVWEQAARGPFGAWSPAVVGGTVFVADERGFVTAFDEATGTQRWQLDLGSQVNSGITFSDGLLVVGDDQGVLRALDASSGEEAWGYPTTAPIHGPVAVIDGIAYFGTTDGHLHALDMATQAPRWPVVQTSGPISRAIAVADGIVYAGSGGRTPADNATLGAFDATTGQRLWARDLEPGNTSTPTVADGRVFIAGGLDASAGDHHVFAFDAKTGEPAWPSPFSTASDRILLVGAVANQQVYVTGTDGWLYVLDAASGELDWRMPIQSSVSPNAAIVGTTLYVTSDDNQVHAFDVADPAHPELWAVPVTGTPGAPTVIDGAIFVNTNSGVVARLDGAKAAASSDASR